MVLATGCGDPAGRDADLGDDRAEAGSDPDGYVSVVLVARPRVEERTATLCATSAMSTECSYNGLPLDQHYGFDVETCLEITTRQGRHEAAVTTITLSNPWSEGTSSGIRVMSATLAGETPDGDLLQIDLPALESFWIDQGHDHEQVSLDPAQTRMELSTNGEGYSPVGVYLNVGGYAGGDDLYCDTTFNVLHRPAPSTVEQIAVYDGQARVREVPKDDDGTLDWGRATTFREQSHTELDDGPHVSSVGVSRFVWNGRIYAFEAVRYGELDYSELRMTTADRGAPSLVANDQVANTSALPGQGPISAITSTIQRNEVTRELQLMQTYWRSNGGYIRTVLLSEGQDVDFPRYDLGQCSVDGDRYGCWSDPVLPDPEDPVLSEAPHSHQLVIDGDVLVQGIWVAGGGWVRYVPAPDQVPSWGCGSAGTCPWSWVGHDDTVDGQSMFSVQ
ncbi:MAG: hypothetical protein AB1Z98_39865 [Nannocystaceae bacterium]